MARGRKKVVVDKEELQNIINELESDNTYKNMSQLCKAVEATDWAKSHKNEVGDPKPLKSQTVYNRYKQFELTSKTTKGRKGRGKKKEKVKAEPDASQIKNRQVAEAMGVDKITRIPAGECPVKLKGTSAEEVFEWCTAVQEVYAQKNECISPEGLVYYVGADFYYPDTEEYKKVVGYIHSWTEITLGVVENV